jgi:DNA processing protein
MIDTLHIVTLLSAPGIGRRTVQSVLRSGSAFALSHPQELRDLLLETKTQFPKIPVPTVSEIDTAFYKAEMILEKCDHLGLKVVTLGSPDFPERLSNIPDPPVLLYIKGNRECLSPPASVAVIGTREPTAFGERSAKKIGATIAAKGLVVVSGLALGCDTKAHEGCISAGGQTVAVLAHGLDRVYPKENAELAESIAEFNGCLISEYAPGTPPRGNLFIERDRLQSGLSDAVIVIETDVKGGTMHTVQFCIEQKRLLGCLAHPPQCINVSKARGNQLLIAEKKAVPLSHREDIDNFIAQFYTPPPPPAPVNGDNAKDLKERQLSFFPDTVETI